MKNEKNLLESLPVLVIGDTCQKCGAKSHPAPNGFRSCNIDDKGNVTDCDRCKERMQ